jgi:hypothetical protein
MYVKDREHYHRIALYGEVHYIWKAPQQRSPNS